MTLKEIRNYTQDILMNRDDISDSRVDAWINDFIRGVCRNYNFSFMETEAQVDTVDGQRSYTLPDGNDTNRYKAEINTELIDYDDTITKITKKSKEYIEEKFSDDRTEKGTPKLYAVSRESIFLYPLPDHSKNNSSAWKINLEYYGFLSKLSNDADVNYLTKNNPWMLVYAASAMGFDYTREEERAKYYKDEVRDRFSSLMKEEFQSRYSERDMRVTPRKSDALGKSRKSTAGIRLFEHKQDGWYS